MRAVAPQPGSSDPEDEYEDSESSAGPSSSQAAALKLLYSRLLMQELIDTPPGVSSSSSSRNNALPQQQQQLAGEPLEQQQQQEGANFQQRLAELQQLAGVVGDEDEDEYEDDFDEDGEYLGGYMDDGPGGLMDFPFDPEDLLDDFDADFGGFGGRNMLDPMFVPPPPDLDFDEPLGLLEEGGYLGSMAPPADFGSDLDYVLEDEEFTEYETEEEEDGRGAGGGLGGDPSGPGGMHMGRVGLQGSTEHQQQQQEPQGYWRQQQQRQQQQQEAWVAPLLQRPAAAAVEGASAPAAPRT